MATSLRSAFGPRLDSMMHDSEPFANSRNYLNIRLPTSTSKLLEYYRRHTSRKRRDIIKQVTKIIFREQAVYIRLFRMLGATTISQLWINNMISIYAKPNDLLLADKVHYFNNDLQEIASNILSIEAVQVSDASYIEKILVNSFPQDNLPPTEETEVMQNLIDIGAPDLWAKNLNGDDVIVAVIDNGIDYTHPDLSRHVWNGKNARFNGKHLACPNHGYNFGSMSTETRGTFTHGTYCAGVIAGDGRMGKKTGVAPHATIMILKYDTINTHSPDSAPVSDWSCWQSMQFAAENNADIVSMSFTIDLKDKPPLDCWRATCDSLFQLGIVHINSAGNHGELAGKLSTDSRYQIPNNVGCPANCPPPILTKFQQSHSTGRPSAVLACGSTKRNMDGTYSLNDSSSRGPSQWDDFPELSLIKPDLCAPGNTIWSCLAQGTGATEFYNTAGSTSIATPHVAGAIALLLCNHDKSVRRIPRYACKIVAKILDKLLANCKEINGQRSLRNQSIGLKSKLPDGYGSGNLNLH